MRLPKEAQVWLPVVLEDSVRRAFTRRPPPQRVWVAICDHYEPFYKNTDEQIARDRVALWRKEWPLVAGRHNDSAGKSPQYSFFYPEEEYRPHLMDSLAEMTEQRIGDVEIHIHHGGEGRAKFIDLMSGFQQTLFEKHGLLRKQPDGKIAFGFIHGNWCLDNSNPYDTRWCGLNDEITILRDLGCYADFTMPSGQHPSQARLINRIYWATDDPNRPKSYDTGQVVEPGSKASGDLLMIPGPFGMCSRGFKKPYFETGELAGYQPITRKRIEDWIHIAPRVGQDAFIKLYAHGTQTRSSGPFFAGGMLDRLFTLLSQVTTQMHCSLRYATAWQMRQAVDAAAAAAV